MMETPIYDSISMQSDDSHKLSTLKETLENLILQESKHSHNYHDLHTRDNFTKLDVDNVENSCKRYEEQKIKKCEFLEEFYDKLTQTHIKNMNFIKDKMTIITKQLEEVNSMFCEAYNDYNSDVLQNTINYLDHETKQLEKECWKNTKKLNDSRFAIEKNLIIPKSGLITSIDAAINLLSESSMKRPEIELEEIDAKIIHNKIATLRKQLQELK